MTSITVDETLLAKSRDFHFRMGLTCLSVAVIGFIPTFIIPELRGGFPLPPVFALHGLVFFAWLIFFCTQAWLVRSGRMRAHREWGVLGAALATAMMISMLVLLVVRLNQVPPMPEGGPGSRSIMWTDVSLGLFYSVCVIAGLAQTRTPIVHKRLMLVATILPLTVAVARSAFQLAPHLDAIFNQASPLALIGKATFFSILYVPALLLAAAAYFDRGPKGRVSRIYVGSMITWIVWTNTAAPTGASPFGLWIADALKHLAG